MSGIFLIQVSRGSRFCSGLSFWGGNWSLLGCSHPVKVWSISSRWESIIPSNSWILLLSESAWSSCCWIWDLASARICSWRLPRRILICLYSRSRLDFRFLRQIWTWFVHSSPRTCVREKGLSWQQTFFKRVISLSQVRWFFSLLSEQWWRERFSDKLIVEFRIERVRRFRVYVDGFILQDLCISLWVVDHVGLITCGRGCISHTLHFVDLRSVC